MTRVRFAPAEHGSISPVAIMAIEGWAGSGNTLPADVAREAVELREEGGFEGLKLRLGRERSPMILRRSRQSERESGAK